MAINVSYFNAVAVTDTCSVWNILSAHTLHRATIATRCCFSITDFILYECLTKPRKATTPEGTELQSRLRTAREQGHFKSYSLSIEDIQDIEILNQRQKLSKGELTAIAFAKKTRQAIITDDQGARKLAAGVLKRSDIQTTPHLLGWLIFGGHLNDTDVDTIVADHNKLGRPLEKYLREMHAEAMRCRLMAQGDTGHQSTDR